ncbi:hypothetical protein FB446DRAFT_719706 [Lentinula raphanica]|nr:hypothetical protein FB446DRAFT_719706 [Lentinula raphanica]
MILAFLRPFPFARPPRVGFRSQSSFIIREPPSSAPRIVPTPLIFVSATSWDKTSSRQGFSVLAQMYAEKGYTCLDTDLSLPVGVDKISALDMMQHFESELSTIVKTSSNPFPPILFARNATCLITQTYISSHPASGLVLISPPSSNHAHGLPEFNYEPQFPIVVVDTPRGMERLQAENRLVKENRVHRIVVDDVEGQEAFVRMEEWMDEIGI